MQTKYWKGIKLDELFIFFTPTEKDIFSMSERSVNQSLSSLAVQHTGIDHLSDNHWADITILGLFVYLSVKSDAFWWHLPLLQHHFLIRSLVISLLQNLKAKFCKRDFSSQCHPQENFHSIIIWWWLFHSRTLLNVENFKWGAFKIT